MLPCVCSVIDHRWRQNVVRKKWHTRRSRVCHWCSYHILTSSVIYYSIRRTATRNLFVLYHDEKPFFISKCFSITRKPAFCTTFAPPLHEKKPFDSFDVIWLIQNEAISLVAKRSKELWLVDKNRATVKPDSSVAPRWMKSYSEGRIELRNLQILKKMQENQVSFCHQSSPVSQKAWTLPWKLRELKKYPQKTCGYGQPRGHLIRVLNERSVRGCLHDTGATFIPARVHSGSLLWLCICLHNTKAKCHAGASSPRFLCRSEIFIQARKFIPVLCKRGMTVRFIFIKVSSILRHYKTRIPTNTALCKHGATLHLAAEWKSRHYHVNTP